MARTFRFAQVTLPTAAQQLRLQVRNFIAQTAAEGLFVPGASSWNRLDFGLSQKIGEMGWIGMTWPKQYGGHERSALERYVVTEEFLAAGFPIKAHYAADRQVGPLILQFGSERQKLKYLPQIAAGKCCCAIGMSEPDSGSDLSAIRTHAVRVPGGWRVDGRKVWTTIAHHSQLMNLFLRTSPKTEDRHAGISRFLVDMSWPGITIRPIVNMAGRYDFNEVIFDGVFVPDDMVLGEIGSGWAQLGSELAYERSAPDRWLASFETLKQAIDHIYPRAGSHCDHAIGRLVCHLWTLRNMSISIACMLENGEIPELEAAVVKDLGTALDQEIPHVVRALLSEEERGALPAEDLLNAYLEYDLLFAPALSIKGGTREILRNAIAKGLSLR